MRCLTLATALAAAGADCAFAATPEAAEILDAFAPPGLERLPTSSGDPAALCRHAAEAARAWGANVAVLDHYDAGADEDALLRAATGRLLALEDLGRPRVSDLLVDSNLGRTAATYPNVEALTGPEYALVRPAFAARRAETLARRRAGGEVGDVLVSLGLTDVSGVTGRTVAALLPVLGERRIEAVLGEGAPSLAELRALAQRDGRIGVHVNAQHMDALTAAADLAIGAGGSSVWERCVLGLPALTLVLADNQRDNTRALAARGAAQAIEINGAFEARLADAFSGLAKDSARRLAMGEAAAGLCDGLGGERVAARLLALP
jgi:UDP-2,4-diacetamido-2,4,6-trideoxy-beta-L-altropyranose hydrolase